MANDASKVEITWTPITSNVYGQAVQRREYGTSNWTTIASFMGNSQSSFTDTSATDMDPQTVYEYRIETTIYYQPSVFTTIDSDRAKNCPTATVTNIFGFKNDVTGTGGNALDFTWFDPEAEWLNSAWGTSKSTSRNVTIGSESSGHRIHLGCHKCGELVSYALSPMSFNPTVNGDFSYMTDYISLASWLPTPAAAFGGNANSNMGNVIRKLDTTYTQLIGGTKFQLGVGDPYSSTFYPFTGFKLSSYGTVSQAPTYTSTLADYNFKFIPNTFNNSQSFSSIKIGTAGNNTLDTALANISGSNTYLAIVDEQFTQNNIATNTPYKCHIHMYKLTRWSNFDYTANSSYRARGFRMTYHNTLQVPISGTNNTYEITSTVHSDVNFYSEDTTTNATTGRRAQPTVYLKIFQV